MQQPTFADVLDARRMITPYVHRTPTRRYPVLSDMLDADVWVKHENFQVLGAFKVRGGLNLVGRAPDNHRKSGFISASTGNHGQSVAFAAATFGSSATIVVPEAANPLKIRAMQALGADVIQHGAFFEESRELAERMAEERGARFVHPANEPLLIAGVGTYSLEIHEDLGEIDYIVVPLGAGSGAAGACIVTDAMSPHTKVIAVQAASAPAAYESWKQGRLVTVGMQTAAEGLATGGAYELPQSILRERLHDFVVVSESRIASGVVLYMEATRTLVEHAGAASLAAALDLKDRLKGKRVVLVASGANIGPTQIAAAIESGS
ncbi:MAG: pyridoxal-phosphate dependent enzyme [Dehalococcoidia bacterium]